MQIHWYGQVRSKIVAGPFPSGFFDHWVQVPAFRLANRAILKGKQRVSRVKHSVRLAPDVYITLCAQSWIRRKVLGMGESLEEREIDSSFLQTIRNLENRRFEPLKPASII